jgi:hypothetical protein
LLFSMITWSTFRNSKETIRQDCCIVTMYCDFMYRSLKCDVFLGLSAQKDSLNITIAFSCNFFSTYNNQIYKQQILLEKSLRCRFSIWTQQSFFTRMTSHLTALLSLDYRPKRSMRDHIACRICRRSVLQSPSQTTSQVTAKLNLRLV